MTAIWKDNSKIEQTYPTLQGTIEVDDVIIGAGITGLATALTLIEAGRRVAVVEALAVADSSTGNSTGNLYSTLSSGLAEVASKWNSEVACEVVKIRERAVSFIEDTVSRFSIDCDFKRVPLCLCAALGDQEMTEKLQAEYEISTQAGLQAQLHDNLADLPIPVGSALRIENQAQFNPYRFTKQLAQAVSELGGFIYEHSQVTEIDPDGHVIKTEKGQVHATNIVQATHTPKGLNALQAEMEVFREYGCAGMLGEVKWPAGIYWMLSDSQSVRSYENSGEEFLVAVGGKHQTGKREEIVSYYDEVQSYLKSHFATFHADFKWSAQQYKSADLLPYIGRSGHENVFVATGFAADGLVWGPVAAEIICSHILGKDHAASSLFNPRRFTPTKSVKDWVKKNSSVAKELFKSYLTPDERAELDKIAPGEGKVMKVDGDELAIYHAPEHGLLAVSSICPHMKCKVAWNPEESSWDCPCHGSRFTVKGENIEGPACEPLQIHILENK